MDNSTFGRLPAELRNEVYHLVFSDCEPVVLQFHKQGNEEGTLTSKPGFELDANVLGLVATCKQVRAEAKSVACHKIHFVVHARKHSAPLALRALQAKLGKDTAAMLTHLRIELGGVRGNSSARRLCNVPTEALVALFQAFQASKFKDLTACWWMVPAAGRRIDMEVDMKDRKTVARSIEACQAKIESDTNTGGVNNLVALIASLANSCIVLQLGEVPVQIKYSDFPDRGPGKYLKFLRKTL